jgi:hypothetical protein
MSDFKNIPSICIDLGLIYLAFINAPSKTISVPVPNYNLVYQEVYRELQFPVG